MSDQPKLSVVMSVYNGMPYLEDAVESILKQTFSDFEFIIIDDASTDETPAILKEFAEEDQRIRLHTNNSNRGLTASLNIGLNMADGEYIARQDADDCSLPHRFRRQVSYLDAHPEIVLVGSHSYIMDANGTIFDHMIRHHEPDLLRWRMLFYNHLGNHSSAMFRREAALAVGLYSEQRRYSQDYELWLQMLNQGDVALIDDKLLKIRQHQGNISHQQASKQEKISLKDSREIQEKLLNRNLSKGEAQRLREFWLEEFPATNQAYELHNLIKERYQAFDKLYHDETKVVYDHIADQFIAWFRSISLRTHPRQKIRLARVASRWSKRRLLADLWRVWRSRKA